MTFGALSASSHAVAQNAPAPTEPDSVAQGASNIVQPNAVAQGASNVVQPNAVAQGSHEVAEGETYAPEERNRPDNAKPLDKDAFRKRDGFFFRFSFGLGPAWYSTHFRGQGHWSAYDQSVQYQLLAGGSVAEGLVVGGGATLNLMGNPGVKGRLDATNHLENVVVGQLQSFVAYYPIRDLGFNVLASVGYCVFASHFSDASWGDDAAGLAVAGGVGYQFQVSPRWALGFQFRLSYAMAAEAGPVKVNSASVFIPALAFTTTYY